nr:MAG TPA: hypothetical protein [Caudoviricetes sp.]
MNLSMTTLKMLSDTTYRGRNLSLLIFLTT